MQPELECMSNMISSTEWWELTSKDNVRLLKWLQNQYHGEVTAAERLDLFCESFKSEMTEKQFKTISIIADQERTHAAWVAQLLVNRNMTPVKLEKVERYWDKTLTSVDTFLKGAAVAAHAEEMRLKRIRAICNDNNAAEDIREVFKKILPQEEFHARAFKKMTTQEEYDRTQHAHDLGRLALGLVP